VSRSWRLERTHDLRKLIEEACQFDPAFNKFTDLANSLTEQFWAQHYPGGDLTEVGSDYDELRRQAGEMIDSAVASIPGDAC